MLLKDSPPTTTHFAKRITLLETTLRFVKWTCVYGAANQKKDIERTGNSVKKIVSRLRFDTMDTPFDERMIFNANAALRYRAGNCSEQTCLAIFFLLSRGETNIHQISVGDHTFLTVGLKEDSNLMIPELIPTDAFILDPWNNMIYPASEFLAKSQHPKANKMLLDGIPNIFYSFQKDGLKSAHFSIDSSEKKDVFQMKLNQFLTDPTYYFGNRVKPFYLFFDELKSNAKLDNPKQFLRSLNERQSSKDKEYSQFRRRHFTNARKLDALENWIKKIFTTLLFGLDIENDFLQKFDSQNIPQISKEKLSPLSDKSIDDAIGRVILPYYRYAHKVEWKALCQKFKEVIQPSLPREIQFSSWQDGKMPSVAYNPTVRSMARNNC